MRLTAADALLDRHLNPAATAPLAVAFSGGGDSLALLLCADAWARRHGRDLVVLHVDHGLQSAGAAWAATCAETARALARPFRLLRWTTPEPGAGLPARARSARHRLLADAARAAGARVLLLGHTADDLTEAEAMRAEGSTVPSPYVFAPSPVWPEGRDLFLLRPLLTLRRQALREALAGAGQAWIDDPANDDPRFARARARRALEGTATPCGRDLSQPVIALAGEARLTPSGGLSVGREALIADDKAERFAAAACLCAAGGDRPPRGASVARLVDRLRREPRVSASLAGARIRSDGQTVWFTRNAGDAARGGLASLSLAAGEAGVWDGRFEIEAAEAVTVRRLAGLSGRLPREQRRRLANVPAAERPALPTFVAASGEVSCPALNDQAKHAKPLALNRLHAACGLVEREPR